MNGKDGKENVAFQDLPPIYLPKPDGHHCFACGTDNPIGLQLRFYRQGERICSNITLSRNHEGWGGLAHGGIISTLLDEVMAWTLLYFKRSFFVTRKMEIKYVRPVLIGVSLVVCGQLTGAGDGEKAGVKGELRDGEGRLLVRSKGEFVLLSEEKLGIVPKGMRDDMRELFEQFQPAAAGGGKI